MKLKNLGLAMAITASIIGSTGINSNACGVGDVEFRVSVSSLNIRSGPGTNYSVVGSVKKGEIYKPFESGQNGAWGKIKLPNSKSGWVYMSYMESLDKCLESETQVNEGIVTADVLNVRTGIGTKYSIKDKLSKGTKVEIHYKEDGWYHIEYKKNGRFDFGYVSKEYIKR